MVDGKLSVVREEEVESEIDDAVVSVGSSLNEVDCVVASFG